MFGIEDKGIDERLTTTATTREMKTSRDRSFYMNFMKTAITRLMQQTVMGIQMKPLRAVKEGAIAAKGKEPKTLSQESTGPHR